MKNHFSTTLSDWEFILAHNILLCSEGFLNDKPSDARPTGVRVSAMNSLLAFHANANSMLRVSEPYGRISIFMYGIKKMMQSESKRIQVGEVVVGLMSQMLVCLGKIEDLIKQEHDYIAAIYSTNGRVRILLESLPKRQKEKMEARYSRQLEETEALYVRLSGLKDFPWTISLTF